MPAGGPSGDFTLSGVPGLAFSDMWGPNRRACLGGVAWISMVLAPLKELMISPYWLIKWSDRPFVE